VFFKWKPDRRFTIRPVWGKLGIVWALFFNNRRIYEVEAMSRPDYMEADARDYIELYELGAFSVAQLGG